MATSKVQTGIRFEANEEAGKRFTIKAGDIVITDKGNQILMGLDYDGSGDLIGIVLNTLKMLRYFRNMDGLNRRLREENLGTVVRVINKENYIIKEL